MTQKQQEHTLIGTVLEYHKKHQIQLAIEIGLDLIICMRCENQFRPFGAGTLEVVFGWSV